jgi:hypothetical protein
MSEASALRALRLGVVFYAAWGVLHVWVAWSIWKLAGGEAAGMGQARLQQDALFMLFFAVASLAFAAAMWRGRAGPYWANLVLVSYADFTWLGLFILPGLVHGLRAWLGPALWIAGLLFSTVGFMALRRAAASRASS